MNYHIIRNFLDVTCNTGFRFKADGKIEDAGALGDRVLADS